jgi:MFS family permease
LWRRNGRSGAAQWALGTCKLASMLAALLNASVGARYGWRAMFAVGGIPAVLVFFIQHGVFEPLKWKPAKSKPMAMLFSHEYRRRTLLNSLFLFVSDLRAVGRLCLCTVGRELSLFPGWPERVGGDSDGILGYGDFVGGDDLRLSCTTRFGRRWTLAGYFALMFISISGAFGCAF